MNENNPVIKALNKAMALCASREYCSNDIRIKLDSWSIKGADAESVISGLISENFINDRRYADSFVKDRFRRNKWGKLKLAAHLSTKKILHEIIESALASIDDEEYRKTARETIISHRKSVKARNTYELKGKLMRYGLSKGFESHILYDILSEID